MYESVIDIKATFIVLPLGRTFQMAFVQDCIILIWKGSELNDASNAVDRMTGQFFYKSRAALIGASISCKQR